MSTSSTRKFLFDTSFDIDLPHRRKVAPEPEPPPPEPEPPPEPTFSQAELLRAHEDGYGDGLAAGRQQAEAAGADRQADALELVGDRLERILAGEQASRAALADQCLRIGVAIAAKLLPDLARREGLAE